MLKLVSILIFISLLLDTNQTAVTAECVECSSSPISNCYKITADGFQKIFSAPLFCFLGEKRFYRVSKCQQTRSCPTNVCYMEDNICISNSSTCNPTTLDYKCGTCTMLTSCNASCWSIGTVTKAIDQTCTNSCSEVTGVKQVDSACSGGVDGSGKNCSCCRSVSNLKPSILGQCSLGNGALFDDDFVNWATKNAKDSGLIHLYNVIPIMLLCMAFLFNL